MFPSIAETFLQQAILFLQVLDRIEVPTMDPAGKQHQKELQRLNGAKHRRQYSELHAVRSAEHPAPPPGSELSSNFWTPRAQTRASSVQGELMPADAQIERCATIGIADCDQVCASTDLGTRRQPDKNQLQIAIRFDLQYAGLPRRESGTHYIERCRCSVHEFGSQECLPNRRRPLRPSELPHCRRTRIGEQGYVRGANRSRRCLRNG